jgi:radical SAM superfamily enzyme with C-terminal helix-hairpin-helix motif
MMKLLSFLGAVGGGVFAGAWLAAWQRRRVRGEAEVNINQASQQELMQALGLDADTADRIVEHRPYPSKIDLLGRMVVNEDVYNAIKSRISYKAS